MASFQLALLAVVLVAGVMLNYKPAFAYGTLGNPKPWGIGLDEQGNDKTLFTMPIVMGLIGFIVLLGA